MPEISRFLGIVIRMYYDEHRPPHFHAVYGDYHVEVVIAEGIVQGRFPKRALRLVLEWLDEHREELLKDWGFAEQRLPLEPIAPLE